MRLHWLPNASASALHAAECIHLIPDKLSDRRMTESLSEYANALGDWIDLASPFEGLRFWSVLIGHAAIIESNHELAQVVLRKTFLGQVEQTAVSQLSGLISDVEVAFNQLFPKFAEQIPLRARPLQDQWLGFGNGLLNHLGRLTEKGVILDEASVVLLQPAIGGAGESHMLHNLVRIEAVLTNPLSELPEVVRLLWLLSQLNLELPMFSELLGSNLISKIAPLAMLPPALAAAEVMELSKCDESIADMAIEHWQIPIPRKELDRASVVPTLMDWWETYLQTKPAFSTALQALGKMLGLQS